MRRGSVFCLFMLPLFAVSTLLVGCTEATFERLEANMMKKVTPPEDEAMVKTWVAWLQQGNFIQIERELDPSLRTDDLRGTLETMARTIPAHQPSSIKVIGHKVVHHGNSSRTVTTTLEYEFPDRWLLAQVVKEEQAETSIVSGFHVYPIPESVESQNRFTLFGKGPVQYLVLLLAFGALAVSIYGIVVCVRTPMGKKKWLWCIVCLVGVVRLTINWTTGATAFVPLWIGAPPSSVVMVPLYTSWIVSTALPIGAVVFLLLRDRLTPTSRQGQSALAETRVQSPTKTAQ